MQYYTYMLRHFVWNNYTRIFIGLKVIFQVLSKTNETRRYPQGIQKLVSTYLLGAQFAGRVVFSGGQN